MTDLRSGFPSATLLGKYGVFALAAVLPFSVSTALATSFTIDGTSTTAQTLGSGSGQTGTVTAGSSLTVGGSTVAVTIQGNDATLINLGTISQTKTGRVVRDNTGVTGLEINNGSSTNASALMQSADADVIQMNKSPASVTLNNYGTMTSLNASKGGAQAVDFTAITSGGNIVNNYATGVIQSQDADAVRPGVNGVVNNWGTIRATNPQGDTGADGIDAQENTGVTITNYATGSISGARHGITGGAKDTTVTFTATITNAGDITGNNGGGLNLDGFNANQSATITNSGTISGSGVSGDGDGIDVDGIVHISNTGIIRSVNAFSADLTKPAQSEGITAGGGTITNAGTIEGLVASGNTNAVGRGITLAGVDSSGTPEAIYADSVITNQSGGLIRGQSDSAIVVDGPASGHTVTITNNAGATIQGGGFSNAAIRTGADNDTVTNAGTIDGSSSGKAIDLGGGDNTLTITGGSAFFLGSINGGIGGSNTLTINPGAGNSFTCDGSISNFDTVAITSGLVTLTGVSDYSGTTLLSGGILQLDGADRLSASSRLNLSGGELEILHAAGANGQSFASLILSGNSTIDLNATGLTFNRLGAIGAGLSLSLVDYLGTTSVDYAFRLVGDYSADGDFLRLMSGTTINGSAAFFQFDGTYTEVSGAPVPEPATWAMMITGLSSLAAMARRKAKS